MSRKDVTDEMVCRAVHQYSSTRGRPPIVRARILARADGMRAIDGRVNKSRIARELHVSLRHVMRVLPRISI